MLNSKHSFLTLENISHSFVDPQGRTQQVIENLSITIDRGETVALWGPSGSGKTTLLNLIAGLIRADAGNVWFQNDSNDASRRLNITDLGDDELLRYRRNHVGYIFQFFNLIETLTVGENVKLALELAGDESRYTAYEARFGELGLEGLVDRFPAELSGGEQQRVAVLRALAHAPALVLADEPTGNLDRINSELVADLLWQQVAEQNAALLIATHSDAIAQRADRVIEIGRI